MSYVILRRNGELIYQGNELNNKLIPFDFKNPEDKYDLVEISTDGDNVSFLHLQDIRKKFGGHPGFYRVESRNNNYFGRSIAFPLKDWEILLGQITEVKIIGEFSKTEKIPKE